MGRTDELLHLAGIADAVIRGDRKVVLISGEAGVGKSRLVSELGRVLRERGFRTLVGRCVEFGEQIWPLAALRELLAYLADEVDAATLDLVLGNSRGMLSQLVPELGAAPQVAPSLQPDQWCESVIGVLQRLGQWGPLMVVIEDLHWADPSTRTLFSLLARSSRPTSLLLVGTSRADLPRRHPLRPVLSEIIRGARPEQLDLERFDRRCTADLVAAIAGDTVDPCSIEEIHRLSEGNVFFIEELVAAHSTGARGFPRSLRDIILARAVSVPESAVDLLSIVAVAGRGSPAVIASAGAVDSEALAVAVDDLTNAGLLLVDGDELRFPHELARTVFLEEIAPSAPGRARNARSQHCCAAARPAR